MDTIVNNILSSLEISLFKCRHVQPQDVTGIERIQETITMITHICDGNYDAGCRNENMKRILDTGKRKMESGLLHENLLDNIKEFLSESSPDELKERQLCILCAGVSFLQLFIQANWTGPPIKENPLQFLSDSYNEEDTEFQDYISNQLLKEDETMYPLISHPLYLLLAIIFLVDSRNLLKECQTVDWWVIRCMFVQQRLLDESSPRIHSLIMESIDKVNSSEIFTEGKVSESERIQFHLECSYIYGFYYNYEKSKEQLANARNTAKLSTNFTGALGKRTQFQQHSIAQLLLEVHRTDGKAMEIDAVQSDLDSLPKDLLLNDETLLNKVQYTDPEVIEGIELSGIEQAVILAMCMEHKRTQPKEELLVEELHSFVQVMLANPKVWCVQSMALMLRSKLEDNRTKTIERSMMQMELLVNQFRAEKPKPHDRMYLFYACNLPPVWTVEREYAGLLIKLGAVKTALEVYLRLRLWEDAIACYQILGRVEKAENLVREQLKIKETPKLLCILGDVTRDHTWYEKAWEKSDHHSARAQRSLGRHYFSKEEYEKSIQHFEMSLKINALQYNVWFQMGFAAMETKKYDMAIKAYHRCASLDSDNFEAWNNLSTAYIRTQQKMKAYRTLQESFRCNYDNWKVWENFLFTCTDVGKFEDLIRAYHRLLDLKDPYSDAEVLQILANAIVQDLPDADGHPAGRLKSKALELFGRQTSKVTNDGKIWKAYATLLGNCHSENELENDKAVQCLQKAHRVLIQRSAWFKEIESCKDVLQESLQLAEAYCRCASNKENSGEAIQLLSSGKLMLKPVLTKIKQTHEDPLTGNIHPDLIDMYKTAEQQLQTIVEIIHQRK
ncbi:tetratricopeptide repeat protein 27-like isoform X2 [Ptychodera flava]|uniref:tetratricopeptide repeat protein 27-like isoform X2 n=1 Tax=Ptychodera flava TaxID=63121 RepID=UPI003969CBD9